MKNYIKSIAVVLVSASAFFASSFVAHAAISWNTLPGDCMGTVAVANHTTQQNASNPCWGSTVSANPGEAINVRIDYDNVGDTQAPNTLVRLNQPMGTQSQFNFTGFVSSSGVQKVGSATVNLTSPATLTVASVYWYANQSGAYTVLNNSDIFNAGANLGTILPSSTCPASNQRCHSGAVIVRFNVGNSTPTPTALCNISTFRVNPTSVSSGASSFVIWNTQNCSSVSVTGLGVSDTRASGYAATPNLTSNTTYTITARGVSGAPIVQSQTVSVLGNPVNNCAITAFNVSPTSVQAGGTANVSWSTSNCTSVSVSGNGISDTATSGNRSTPALYNNATYTITASGVNGAVPSQSRTVSVNSVTPNCAIGSFDASSYTVASGGSATLTWNTTNCTSVSMSGVTIPSNQFSGSVSTGPIYGSSSYTLTAYGTGGPVTRTVNINTSTPANCQINSFVGPAYTVSWGNTATLSWSVSNCTSVSIPGLSIPSNQFSGSVTTQALYGSTTYTLNAYGTNSVMQTQTVPVTVQQYQNQACTINSFNGPSQINSGSSATLNWTTSNCSYVTISGPGISNGGSQSPNGSISTNALYGSSNNYTITAYSSTLGGSDSDSLTVSTTSYQNQYCSVSSFYASPTYVSYGGTTTLVWNTYGCNSVTISGGNIGSYSQPVSGSTNTGAIYGSTTYTLTAYNNYGSPITQSVTVTTDGGNYYQSSPTVTTNQATNTYESSATLNGYVSTNNSYTNCSYYSCGGNYSYYFQYGTSQYSLTNQTQTLTGSYASPVSAYITGLSQNTTYYFRLVAYNNYGTNYGNTLSFVTGGGAVTGSNIVTSIATNISTSTARLNGVVVAPAYSGSAQAYFEYGTTLALGNSTTAQTVATNNVMNYFDGISVSPNTVYYFRAVGIINGITYKGSTVSFTTPTAGTPIRTVVVSTPGTGSGSTLIMLTIDSQFQNVSLGDVITYNVHYKNISNGELRNATLNVILPSGVTFKQSTMGVLTTSNTVAVNLGTIPKDAEGTMTIQAIVENATRGDTLLATANLAFSYGNNTQDSVVAYAMNNVANNPNSSLTGLAFFGGNFFPTTLLGWVLLIGLIILIIIIIRRIYGNGGEQAPAHAVAHGNPHHVDNLPH